MFTLKGRKDCFKLTLPDDFLVDEIVEKYTPILQKNKQYIYKPIDFLNETIQKVQIFGFQNASFEQEQTVSGYPIRNPYRTFENEFYEGSTKVMYRNAVPPTALVDNTINIEFRHTLGYLNYMIILENFMYLYTKDTRSNKMFDYINLEMFNQIGEVYAKVQFQGPVINSMDMLDFDFTQPVAQSGTFKLEIKYTNFDYQFITENLDASTIDVAVLKEEPINASNLSDDIYI